MDQVEAQLRLSPGSDFWDSLAERRFQSLEDAPGCVSGKLMVGILDHELVAIARLRCLFLRRRNAHTPICRLPAEILARIFSLVPHHLDASHSPHLQTVQQLARVCFRWRSVALSHAALWSNINLARLRKDHIPDVLARSAGHMLDIKACGCVQHKLLRSPLSPQDWSRVRSLAMCCTPSELARLPYGLLQSLEYLSAKDEGFGVEGCSAVLFAAPDQSALVLPRLSTLILRGGFSIAWTHFPKLPLLTHLEVSALGSRRMAAYTPPAPLSYEDTAALLRRLPHLQTLSLAGVFPWDTTLAKSGAAPACPAPEPRIALPHLTSLRLDGRSDICARLFGALDTHPAAEAAVSMVPYTTTALDVLLAACRRRVAPLRRLAFRLKRNNNDASAELVLAPEQRARGPRVRIRVECPADVLLATLRARLALAEVVQLDLETTTHWNYGPQRPRLELFRDTPSVTHLAVRDDAVGEAIAALGHVRDAAAPERAGARVLPRLRCLEVEMAAGAGAAVQMLAEALRVRYEAGAGLHELCIGLREDIAEEAKVCVQRYVDAPVRWNVIG